MERTRSRPLSRHLAGRKASRIACIVITALLAFACAGSKGSFSGLLARIDANPVSASADVYIKAGKLANSTEDRLRILKRASRTAPEVYADTARAVLSAGTVTGPVIMAVLDALIEDGACMEALSLFDGTIDPHGYPSAYAELLVRCHRAGYAPAISMERAVLCTDVTGDIRWMLGAAIDAMLAGDRGTATLMLADAETKGHAMPYRLLWDARMLQVLADRIPQPSDPLELAVCADAAHLLGREATAAFLYSSIVARFPDWSWKPYAALARQVADPAMLADPQWPHVPLEGSWESLSSPVEMVERLHRIIEVKFPHSAGAAVERSRWLYGQGRLAEAAALVSGEDAESAAARLRMAPLDRVVPLAHQGAAMYPESGTVVDVALEMLASSGSWGDFRQLLARIERHGTNAPRLWFWRVLMKALDGDPAAAALDIRIHGPGHAGYTGILDIAMLELAAGNPGQAREAALVAVGMGENGLEKARALILLGDAEHAVGSLEEARDTYKAALNADPESRIARSRLERLDVPR